MPWNDPPGLTMLREAQHQGSGLESCSTSTQPKKPIHLATLADALTDAVFVKDRSGRYLYCNEATVRHANKSIADVLGKDDTALLDPRSARIVVESDQRVILSGQPETREEELFSGSERRTFHVTKAPFRDDEGNIVGIVGIARDITMRKQAEVLLRESERRLSEAERLAHVGYWELDLLTGSNQCSDETYRIFGLTAYRQNYTTFDFWSTVHSEDIPEVRNLVEEAMRCAAPIDFEYRAVRPNGEIRIVHSRGRAIFDETGRPITLFGVLQDITEYRAAQEALRTSERDLAAAQRVAQLGNWRLHMQTGAVDLSEELYRLLGIEKASFRGTFDEILERIHPNDRALARTTVSGVTAEHPSFDIEYRVPLPGRKDRIIRAIGHAEIAVSGEVRELFGTAQDITERKRIEIERERLHQEVLVSREQLAELSRRILEAHESERRNLAHELHDEIGQILTAVNLNLETLRSKVSLPTASRLEDSIQVVTKAIDQIRDLSLSLWPASIDLLGLEAALDAFLNRAASRTRVDLTFDSSLNGGRLPRSLETICFRIVQKALTNVLRHAQARRCWVALRTDGGFVEVSVRDDGVGFDIVAANEQAILGKGFGLLGMRETVELLAGELQVESTPGKGTCILARLPLSS